MAEEKKKEAGDGEKKEADAASSKKGKKKTMLIVGGIVGLIVLIGVPVSILMLRSSTPKDVATELSADAAQGEAALVPEGNTDDDELLEGEEPLGAFFPLETFVLNLDENHFIRVQINLQFASKDISKRFYARLIPIRDALIGLIATKKSDLLLSEKGKEGLRTEVRDRINEILRKEEVKQVYFTQFVIQ